MIIDIIGSFAEDNQIDINVKYLRSIVKVINDEGHILANNWIESGYVRKKKKVDSDADWKPLVDISLNAIKKCDLVIAELTHYTFGNGYQIAAAIEENKPILILSRVSLDSEMISGLQNPLLTYVEYTTEEEMDKAVRTFLKLNTVHTKDLRFNMFLTREIIQFLDKEAAETGVNRSEIIRKLIRQKAKGTENE